MKTAIIIAAALLSAAGVASAYERCSDRTGYCIDKRYSQGTHGMTVFRPAPNQPVDDRPGL